MNYHLRKLITNCWCVVCILIAIGITSVYGFNTLGFIIGSVVGLILFFIEFILYFIVKGAAITKNSRSRNLICPECLVNVDDGTGICPKCGRKL
jgi:hypothetical protein